MNKFLKYGLLGMGGVGLLAAGVAAYFAATFNPNDYKAQIVRVVKDRTQRTLALEGDIRLTLFPGIGMDIGKASLSEFNSEKEFAAVDGVHVSLALRPLFSGQVVADGVTVRGLRVALVKFKNGKTNMDDLLAGDASKPANSPVKFEIASVRVEKSELDYRDENTGVRYTLKDITLRSGRIANGVPGKIDFAAVIHASQPRLDLATHGQALLTFDLEKQRYEVAGLDLQAQGSAFDINDLVVRASGDASADFGAHEFSAKHWLASAAGSKDKNKFDARLDAPLLSLAGDKLSADTLTLELELGMFRRDRTYKVKLSSPVNGDLGARQFNLPGLVVAVNVGGDKLPGRPAGSEMKGNAQVDVERQSVRVNLAGGLLQSQVKAKMAVTGLVNPAIRFDVDVDQFDADLYFPVQDSGGASGAAATGHPFDLAALKKLNLEGSLRIGSLKVSNVKSARVRLDIGARHE